MIISIYNPEIIETSQIHHTHYFIRKRLRVRQNKKKMRFHKWFIFLVLAGTTNQNETAINRNMEQNMPNGFIQTEYNNIHLINLQFHSIWSLSAKKSTFNVTSSYLWILLLLSGDIELNPGPANQFNYTLSHHNLCCSYRTSLYFVFKCIKLVPRKDDKGIGIYEDVSPDESINDVKAIFNNRFNMSELDFVKFHKHNGRILSIIAKWGKNRGREDKELYLNTFSVVNWLALNESTKLKHTVLCNECEITHLNVHAKFPANSPMYSAEKQKLSLLVENSNGGKLKDLCDKLKPNLKRLLNKSFSDLHDKNGKPKKVSKKDLKNLSLEIISLYESYAKSKQLEPKKNYKEKRTTERQMFKKVVDQIQDQNDSNCVNRLYGADISLRGWDLERKRNLLKLLKMHRSAHMKKMQNLKVAKKKKKDHTGNFSSYNLQKSELESHASTRNSETKVIWKHVGDKLVKGKENMPPSNSGQIAKHYLLGLEAEGTVDLSFTDNDKRSKKVVRRSLRKVGHKVSVPVELSASQVRKKLQQQILLWEIDIGKGIVEREYQKVSISKTGEVTIKTFKVEGRKHPLSSIRKTTLFKIP